MCKNTFLSPVPILSSYARENFDCGNQSLNIFLKQYALQNSKNNASRTYVSLNDKEMICGYYTLTFGSISHIEATDKIKKRMPNYPIPIIILARLAVSKSCQKMGLGRSLLKDAVLRTLQASDIAGLKALVVHAKDKYAQEFYIKYGFEKSPIDEYHMMITMDDIHQAI